MSTATASFVAPFDLSCAWFASTMQQQQSNDGSQTPPPTTDTTTDVDALLASVFASIPDFTTYPRCETLADFAAQNALPIAGPSSQPMSSLPLPLSLPTLPWDLDFSTLPPLLDTPALSSSTLATTTTSSATTSAGAATPLTSALLSPDVSAYDTRAAKWAAVLAREPAADAAFVYCVITTKIFCRPTCPSRRPLENNVDFARTPAEAMGMGYRACRRCLPDCLASASETRQVLAVEHAKAILNDCIDNKLPVPNLAALSAQVGMSKFHFQRTFKRLVGESPDTYARSLRSRRPR
ncbi:Bifunctional transcriptional activator/DNA repair enzyme Ada [Vanrija pseudolonga]|uniref:Bifunctional transcriptional activator/DNA repair enzyme Ada n=1 Tax=Vanrija pseudolonga TaxID=143232 RepID=A0AAF1BHV7_9TREE|nr:Bifunctional transcriptional activator/DNA repair enzyme Ada [Vanrija pseudolonga]